MTVTTASWLTGRAKVPSPCSSSALTMAQPKAAPMARPSVVPSRAMITAS